ncbi:MAG TPA: oligosaccharide flippase family protein [Trueperaceae bacterium]|nr:oligosaccharide flippase family protein [Trueperaceae bacterium]
MRPESPTWVAIQQLSVRGLVAVKFLVVARILGPNSIGEVVVALVTISVAEALTQIGLEHSIIQTRDRLSVDRQNAAWTMQFARGLLIALALLLGSGPIAGIFGSPESARLVAFSALIPFLRNTLSIGYAYAQRDRRFRPIGISNLSSAVIDVLATAALIVAGLGVTGVILGTVAGEAVRFALSYVLFPVKVRLTWRPSEIPDLLRYGRWIWASGLIVAALDQVDKAVIGIWLGVQELGLYQMAGRLSQLLSAEFGLVFGRYLFPTISEAHRNDPALATALVSHSVTLTIHFALVVILGMETVGSDLVIAFLGAEWEPMLVYLRVLLFAMAASGLNSILAAYLRAVGRPSTVAIATAAQLLLALVFYVTFGSLWQGIGIAIATALSTIASTVMLYFMAGRLSIAPVTVPLALISVAAILAAHIFPAMNLPALAAAVILAVLIARGYWRVSIRALVNVG